VTVYKLTDNFPKSETFGLANQMRRAAVSIPSNIAEGHGRPTRDYARFLSMARGSLSELETQIELAQRIHYLSPENCAELTHALGIIGRQLNTLLRRLKARIDES
jgi:four helix bundle protein